MSHFRKKPVVIEAFQWDGTITSTDAIQRWAGTEPRPGGPQNAASTYRFRIEQPAQFGPLLVHTLEGDVTAQKGDWIIKGVKGEFYPCKPDIFAKTYDAARAKPGGFCTHCGHEVASFEGLRGCPSCGTTGVPCAYENQVDVSVNWHELRILVIWAENYGRGIDTGNSVVYAIARRLQLQHPSKPPLSLAGEVGAISKQFETEVSSPALRRDIAEQTGEEVGLIRQHDLPPQKESE